ncbi:MAG: family oxidoreductase [Rhodocyclales bacterium]|nr:family oxidoreductase [Rhodocyclales bacterium]
MHTSPSTSIPSNGQNTQRVAFVTGGGRGLGAAICDVLTEDRWSLLIADVNAASARDTAGRLRDAGHHVHAAALDVTNPTQVTQVVDEAIAHFGRIDALINNAAVDVTLPIDELQIDDWQRVMQTNLSGPFLLAKQLVPHMREKGGGYIVNIASTASRRAWPNAAAYHASKWGLLGLSHALHAELRPHGIKVSAVIAGGMRTPFLLDRFPDIDPGVLQDPVNVAKAVRFALSQPDETVIPEIMVLPMRESSWP